MEKATYDLAVFPDHQRGVIVFLLEEIGRLKVRLASLEKDRAEVNRLWEAAYPSSWKEDAK